MSRKRKKKGNSGNGLGHLPNVLPLARGMTTKNKRESRDREDRKRRQRGWDE